MDWIEVCINTEAKLIDERCSRLTELGAEGFVIENEEDFRQFLKNNRQYWDYVDKELEDKYKGISRIKCYFSDDEKGLAVTKKIESEFGDAVSTAKVKDSDWENNWRQYYEPIEVGNKLVVVPEWLDTPDDGRIPLRLDPGLIFGTGSHPTTKMCLSALEEYAGTGKKVLDLGCGSGILGIGSLVLGCKECTGCDIDPKAPEVALDNAKLNNITEETFRVFAGDIIKDNRLKKKLSGIYDIVLANIVADVIITLSAAVGQYMNEDSIFITSGIIEGRQAEVQNELEKNGFIIIGHKNEEEWHCFICRKG